MDETRFWLFGGPDYYPSGGVDDLVGRFATVEAAEGALRGIDTWQWSGWAHLLDTAEMTVVRKWERSPDQDWVVVGMVAVIP